MASAGMGEGVASVDEEFQHHLSVASDRLAKGDVDGAREPLRRASARLPEDGTSLGLLGQACYRAGLFDEAAAAYGRLVDENPAEISARVNLGLAWLKGGKQAEAVKQFSIAIDLDPEHKRAMGYLGLALLESGDPRGARAWFEKSGSPGMVARCEAMITDRDGSAPPEPTPGPATTGAPPSPGGLGAFAEQRTVRPPPEVFAIEGGILHVAVRGELVCRLDGLFAVRGAVTARPEVKRFRGKLTEKPFGAGRERMNRVAGEGALFFRTGGWVFTVIDLAGDAGYFREEAVFALEEAVVFENGRVPSRHSRDLDLVHLRGRGRMLIRTVAAPVAIEISGGEPLRVPPQALVGWTGAVTPRIGLLAAEGVPPDAAPPPGAPIMVELNGDGRVFVDPDASPVE